MKKSKIVIIDNYDSFVFNLIRYIEEISDTTVSVMRNNRLNDEELEDADIIILSPGPGIPSEAGRLMEVIEKYVFTKKILGVCLGHQALGEFFGMKLKQCNEPIHGKTSRINCNTDNVLYRGLENKMDVGRYHSWEVTQTDLSQMETIAETDDGMIMSIQHRELPIFGMQYHPESILTPNGRKQIENFLKL